ncbi:MAG TPA: RNA polymerase sigma factor [Gemmataceae bacterium]|nr:RNA polymerase sigma factor [Gemmataceae bacterium]
MPSDIHDLEDLESTKVVSEPTDQQLLEELRSGGHEAATTLYRRYAKRLRQLIRSKCSAALARRLDADDILQSVFHAFFKGAKGGCYQVPAGEELWPLLLVIALNKIRTQGSFHRAAKRDIRLTCGLEESHLLKQSVQELETHEPMPLLQLVANEALERIPPSQREIIQLRVAGHEVEEIAQMVGRSKRTVERILQTCRQQLSELLEEVETHGDSDVREGQPTRTGRAN